MDVPANIANYERDGDPSSTSFDISGYERDDASPTNNSSRTISGTAKDVLGSLGVGGVQAVQGAIGLADLAIAPLGGRGAIGNFVSKNVVDLDELAKSVDDYWASDAQKEADKKLKDTKGFWATAVAMGENPSTIIKGILTSLPSMYAGGGVGKATQLIAKQLPKGLEKFAPSIAKRLSVSDMGAAAIGEGAISAGSLAEDVRSKSKDGDITSGQQAIAAGSGLLTGGIARVSGAFGKKFGIDDPEEAIVRGSLRDTAVDAVGDKVQKGVTRRIAETAFKEGVIEELPQSATEQIASNYAQGKPWTQGVPEASAQGMVIGAGQGGGFTAIQALLGEDPEPQTTEAPKGPSKSMEMAQSAFADISGDEQTVNAQGDKQALIALSLYKMDNDERSQAIQHLSGGDAQLANKIQTAVNSPEVIKRGRALFSQVNGAMNDQDGGYLFLNHQIKSDAGLLSGISQPTAVDVTQQVMQNIPQAGQPLNNAGYITEPISNLNAQLQAVRDGRKPAFFVPEEQAGQFDFNGLAVAQIVDPQTGEKGIIASQSQEVVQNAAQRALAVGLKQAAGEALGYVNPTATAQANPNAVAVQNIDHAGNVINEQIVSTPGEAANVAPISGTETRMVRADQALQERMQAAEQQNTAVNGLDIGQNQQVQQKRPVEITAVNTVVDGRGTKTTKSANQKYVAQLVATLNSQLSNEQKAAGLEVDNKSITQVDIPKKHALNRMVKAIKIAFGVDVAFAELNGQDGSVQRKDGTYHSKFNMVALPSRKLIIVNAAILKGGGVSALVRGLFGHELAHILQKLHPDLYAELELTALSRVSYQRALKHRETLLAHFKKEGKQEDLEAQAQEIRDELTAEAVGDMAQDEAFWKDLYEQVGEDGSKARRLFDAVINTLTAFARAFTGQGFIEGLRDLKHIRAAATEGYLAWSRRYEAETGSMDNYSPESQKQIKSDMKVIEKQEKELVDAEKEAAKVAKKKATAVKKESKPAAVKQSRVPLKPLEQGDVLPSKLIVEAKATVAKYKKSATQDQEKDPLSPEDREFADKALTPLLENAQKNKPAFDDVLRSIAEQLGGFAKTPGIKKLFRAGTKLVKENHKKVSLMKDLLRGTVAVRDVSEINAAIKMIGEHYQFNRIKNRVSADVQDQSGQAVPFKPMETGYADVLTNVILEDGLVAEIQISTPEMLATKNLGHEVYAIERELPKGVLKADLRGLQRRIYDFGTLSSRSNNAAISSLSASKSERVVSPALWRTSDGLHSWSPSGQAIKATDISASVTTGLSSQSKNRAPLGKLDRSNMEDSVASNEPENNTELYLGNNGEQDANPQSSNLTRFSRTSILAVANGNRIAPLKVLDKPTRVMQHSGLGREVPIKMEGSVVLKLLTGKDGLRRLMSVDEILSLKEKIQAPIAVFDDPTDKNSVVFLTDLILEDEPIVVAVNRNTKEGTYNVDNVDHLGRKTRGATTEKVGKFSPLKTAHSKDVAGMLAWLNKSRMIYFNPQLSPKLGLFLDKRLVAAAEKSRAYKEKPGRPLDQTAYDSASIASTLGERDGETVLPDKQTIPQRTDVGGDVLLDDNKTLYSRSIEDESPKLLSKLPAKYRKATLIDLLYGDESHPVFKRSKSSVNAQIAHFLQERSLKALGRPLDESSKHDQEIISSLLAAEALAAMSKDENGAEWYDSSIEKTIDLAAIRYPEIKSDKKHRVAFALSIAITSQGMNVEDNMNAGLPIYESWVKNKVFPTDTAYGKHMGDMNNSFEKANKFIEELGWGKFMALLNSKYSNKFLKNVYNAGTSDDLVDHIMHGSSAFGPKIGGGFFQNLMGNFWPVTMDLWFSRTIGRLSGKILSFNQQLLSTQIDSLREEFSNPHDSDKSVQGDRFADRVDHDLFMSDDDYAVGVAIEIAMEHERDYKQNRSLFDRHQRFKSKLVNVAEAIENNLAGTNDAPQNGEHRNQLRDIVNLAVAKIKKETGKDLYPASLQALVWYPEQRLYKKLGGLQRVVGQDYTGAIIKTLKAKGVSDEQIKSALESSANVQRRAVDMAGEGAGLQRTGEQGTAKRSDSGVPENRGIRESAKEESTQAITFEVAPSPDDKKLHSLWSALPQEKKIAISMKLGKKFVKKALASLGMSGTVEMRIGSYIDSTTPSFTIKLNKGGDPMLAAGLIGYVLAQKEMMITSETEFGGSKERGVVTIDLPDGLSMKQIDDLYQNLRKIKNSFGESVVGGQTTANNRMAILNFSEYSSEQITTEQLAALIDKHLGGKYTVGYSNVFSAMPGEKDYNYGSGEQNGDAVARRPSIKRDANSLRADAAIALAKELGIETITRQSRFTGLAELAGRPSISGDQSESKGLGVQAAIHYGTQAGLSTLEGSMWGKGIRGAEGGRLNKPGVDPRIKKRVYFYLPVKGGIPAPESGLGGYVYSADLSNLYDQSSNKLKLPSDPNAMESHILNAGYRGYINREQGTAVVLNESVPVKFLGNAADFHKVQRIIRRLESVNSTRVEGDELVRKPEITQIFSKSLSDLIKASAPSFHMEYGYARVKASEAENANKVIATTGNDFRFSRSTTEIPVDVELPGGTLKIKNVSETLSTLESKLAKYQQLLLCLM